MYGNAPKIQWISFSVYPSVSVSPIRSQSDTFSYTRPPFTKSFLYKFRIRKRRSPRWINDLHSRFIVWAKMKYFSFLICFRLVCAQSTGLYTYLSVSVFVCLPIRLLPIAVIASSVIELYLFLGIERATKSKPGEGIKNLYDCERKDVCLNELWK